MARRKRTKVVGSDGWKDIRPPTEFDEQTMLCDWLNLQHPDIVYWYTPNEGVRTDYRKYWMHRSGMLSGAPDLVILTHKQVIFLELKRTKGGHLSPSQKMVHGWIRALGYTVLVCHGFERAKEALEPYLKNAARSARTHKNTENPCAEVTKQEEDLRQESKGIPLDRWLRSTKFL